MKVEHVIVDEGYGAKKLVIHRDYCYDDAAELAVRMIERWGQVAAIDDGEDSAGRAKLRLATPEELVTRAFEVAELYVYHAAHRGHVIEGVSKEDLMRAINRNG